ncbi:uncharacterized protein isoform X2 [Choristoneura fumiferana]|uniref:uncharacterized protein isoform X2 n=1 Tax=Choristoneura fumiferana TaxID=7141 RepID=UPI003D15C6C0
MDFSERKKRNRVPNFTTEEKMILTQLVNEKKNILDSKLTDGPSIVRKKMAWEALTLAYNSNLGVHKRDTATLKRAWDNLKAMTRKVRRARAIERAGDGPVLPSQPPPQQVAIMNMVEQACPAIMCEIYNPYDSDAVTRASNNSQSESFQLPDRPSGSNGELAPNQLYECQIAEGGEERTSDQLYECQIREGVAENRAPNRLNERRRRAPARTNDILIRREAALRTKAMEMKLKILKLKLDTRASKSKRTELLLEAAQLEVEAKRKDGERAEMLRQAAQMELEFQRRRLSQTDNLHS